MGIVIDTGVFIHAERNNHPIAMEKWEQYGNVYISVITVSELLVGVHRANSKDRELKRSAFVEAIVGAIPILPITVEVARLHAELHGLLIKNGSPIGAHDLLISATALAGGHALLTANHSEFYQVPGLTVLEFP